MRSRPCLRAGRLTLAGAQSRIEHIFKDAKGRDPEKGPLPFFTHYGEVTDLNNLVTLLNKVKPIEFYNLAAQRYEKLAHATPLRCVRELDACIGCPRS